MFFQVSCWQIQVVSSTPDRTAWVGAACPLSRSWTTKRRPVGSGFRQKACIAHGIYSSNDVQSLAVSIGMYWRQPNIKKLEVPGFSGPAWVDCFLFRLNNCLFPNGFSNGQMWKTGSRRQRRAMAEDSSKWRKSFWAPNCHILRKDNSFQKI